MVQAYSDFWMALLLVDVSRLEEICASWGIKDVQMMSTATLQRPFDPARAKASGQSALEKPLLQDVYRLQMDMKKRAKDVLGDTSRTPQELFFVGRNMNLVRSVNKRCEYLFFFLGGAV